LQTTGATSDWLIDHPLIHNFGYKIYVVAKSVVNPHRFDPYKNFKFRISMEGRTVAGIDLVAGLTPAPGSVKKKSGTKMPGLQKFGNLTLKRVSTQDDQFYDWLKSASGKFGSDAESKYLRKSMVLEVCNESGELIASYRMINAWVTKFEAPELNAKSNDMAIDTLELSYEGLELIRS
jgi:phage tail-like protein